MNNIFNFFNYKITIHNVNKASTPYRLEEYNSLKNDIIFKVIGKSIYISYDKVNEYLTNRVENLIGWYYNEKRERMPLIIKEDDTHFIIGCESIEKKTFKLQFLNIKKQLNEQN